MLRNWLPAHITPRIFLFFLFCFVFLHMAFALPKDQTKESEPKEITRLIGEM